MYAVYSYILWYGRRNESVSPFEPSTSEGLDSGTVVNRYVVALGNNGARRGTASHEIERPEPVDRVLTGHCSTKGAVCTKMLSAEKVSLH
jgi:hypothetical protein